jgi:PPOX class probable FMN-dependent enzyme
MTETVFGHSVEHHIKTSEDLRTYAKPPSHRVDGKVIDHIDDLSRRFIEASSLVILSSQREDGGLDMTPRGDPPGFVGVLSEKLLALPDRPGNFRMDTFENVMRTGEVGLIFIIPGHRDTLRVSGKAALVRDETLGQKMAIKGRNAEFVLLIQVERVLCHCPKAFVRGKVWLADAWPDTSDVPSLAAMMVAHAALADTVDEMQAIIDKDGETRLY